MSCGGQVDVVGDAEAGKTSFPLAAAAEALWDGLCVLALDMDHNGRGHLMRLMSLGAALSALTDRGRFSYGRSLRWSGRTGSARKLTWEALS